MTQQEYLAQVDAAYTTFHGHELESRIQNLCETCRADCGPESGEYAALLNELGAYYKGEGRFSEAEDCFCRVLSLLSHLTSEHSPAYATALNNLAGTHRLLKQYEKAESEFRRCLELYRSSVGEEDVLYAAGLNNLSLVCLDTGRLAEAARLQRSAADILSALPACKDELAASLCNLGTLLQRLGRLNEAAEHLKQAIALFRGELGTNTPHYHAALNALGAVRYAQRDFSSAQALFLEAAQAAETLYGPEHWEAQAAAHHAEMARQAAGEAEK